MFASQIERHFTKIGARARIHPDTSSWDIAIDIRKDGDGEYFDIALGRNDAELSVMDVQPGLRHLLLMSRTSRRSKFLCGHDERHWFVAAVPESAPVSNVKTAFEALKPLQIRTALVRKHVRPKDRNRRRNEAFLRQGEWFFVPADDTYVPETLIFRNEPISRGRGKPHLCEELVRSGGEVVYVCSQYPRGVTSNIYRKLMSKKPELRSMKWVIQRRNPEVFVRGRVRHSDHKTIELNGWHRVFMNTENQAAAMRNVVFLD
ncbi:MAG TPA: hypothetical protein VM452_04075 [Caulifigura sp.]|nr:hypothetical protein [Caulifigura sp.]